MPIKMNCPACAKDYTLADTMEGKKVKCKGCGTPFTVAATSTAVATKAANGKPKTAVTTTRPSEPGAQRTKDTDVGASGGTSVKKKSSMGLWVLIGGGLVGVLFFVCAGGSIGAYFLFFRGSAVTKANYDKIKGGMTTAQVKDILGKPDKSEEPSDLSAFGGKSTTSFRADYWESGKKSIIITFADDKVFAWVGKFDGAEYTMSDPSVLFGGPSSAPRSDPTSRPGSKPASAPTSAPTISKEKIVGKWDQVTEGSAANTALNFEFTADGKFKTSGMLTADGTYTVDGDKLTTITKLGTGKGESVKTTSTIDTLTDTELVLKDRGRATRYKRK
jgi:uncharacterized protein (TIGR03066 family)